MEKRILYIIPGTGIDDQEKERRAKVLNSFAGKEYAVEVEVAKIGPPSIESYNDEYLSIPETLSMVSGAEERGYAAIIIGCYSDPGIDAARELVNIPVVGPGQSTMLLATALGEEYSILCTLASVRKWLAKYARKVGAAERL